MKDDIFQISKRAKVSKIIRRFSRFFKIRRNYPVTPQYPGTPKKSHLGSKRLPNTPSGNPDIAAEKPWPVFGQLADSLKTLY